MLHFLLRDSERIGALAHATRYPAHFGKLHLARRTTAARRKRVASRRCSGRSKIKTYHNQRGTARARSKLARCASSRDTASTVARSRMPRERRLILGGRSWHVAPRPRAERERLPAGVVAVYCARADHNQRSTACAQQQARMLHILLRDTERICALAHATRKPAHFRRPHLARRDTAACRKREASRRCSGRSKEGDRSQPARHGAPSQPARALRLLPRCSEHSGALAHAT